MAFPSTPTTGQVYTTSDGRSYVYTLSTDSWDFQGKSTTIKNNLSATTAPSVADSSTNGYTVGSLWVNVASAKYYYCVDSTANSGVWSSGSGAAIVATTAPGSASVGDFFHNTTTDKTFLWDGFSWIDVVAGGSPSPKLNTTATAAPTALTDSTQGYSVGSMWIDTVANKVYTCVKSNASAAVWTLTAASISSAWVIKTTSYTAIIDDYIFVDTNGGPTTITLPAGGSLGSPVTIVDYRGTFSTNNCTVARNGSTIMGSATDMILNTNNQHVVFTYTGTDWRITA